MDQRKDPPQYIWACVVFTSKVIKAPCHRIITPSVWYVPFRAYI